MELQRGARTPNDQPAHAVALPADVDATRLLARRGLLEPDRGRRTACCRTAGRPRRWAASTSRRSAWCRRRPPSRPSTSTWSRRRCATATAATSTARASCWPGGWSRRACGWCRSSGCTSCPNGRVANVWDNHGGYGIHGAKHRLRPAQGAVLHPAAGPGLSALLEDLARARPAGRDAGGGGRRVRPHAEDQQRRSGRDHWGACQSALLAGGGIRGGQVYGASDAQAAYRQGQPGVAGGLAGDDLPRAWACRRTARSTTAKAGRTASARASR